ncbi:hypothetical protein AX16_007931 [Volvariella volvacea WC 439]|nr:hypothetical protein AX16_007931 [Volvariella volvacea WC 439]
MDLDTNWEDISGPESVDAPAAAVRQRRPLRKRVAPGLHGKPFRARQNARLRRRANLQPPSPLKAFLTTGWRVFVYIYVKGALTKAPGRIQVVGILLFLFLFSQLWTKLRGPTAASSNFVCQLPVVSRLNICYYASMHLENVEHPNPDSKSNIIPPSDRTSTLCSADFPSLIEVQVKYLDKLLEGSAKSAALSLEIKKAEMATSDLITVVKHSNPKSKDMLARMLVEFMKDAGTAGQGLQTLNTKVGGAVDRVTVANDHAIHKIKDASASLPKPGSIASLMPWSPKSSDVQGQITTAFTDAMNTISSEIAHLAREAQLSLSDLRSLEDSLSTLTKNEALTDIWTSSATKGQQLRDIRRYRDQAQAQVASTLRALSEMTQGIEELKTRVAGAVPANLNRGAPESGLGREGPQSGASVACIAVSLHIESIQMGSRKLKEAKERAKVLYNVAVRKVFKDRPGE